MGNVGEGGGGGRVKLPIFDPLISTVVFVYKITECSNFVCCVHPAYCHFK